MKCNEHAAQQYRRDWRAELPLVDKPVQSGSHGLEFSELSMMRETPFYAD